MEEENAGEIPFKDIKFDSFTDKELASLTTFHDQILKILNSRLVQNGSLKCHHEISYKREDGFLKQTISCPDDEEIAYVLMLSRPFIQKNNQTRIDIEHIISILKSKSADDKTSAHFDSMEKNYRSFWKNSTILVKNGAKEYTSKDVFDNILYADKFHTDGDKKKLIKGLELTEPTKKAMFYEALISICNWAQLIDRVIAEVISKNDSF